MTPLFFFHLPKAGGTSVRSALARQFAAGECAPTIENDTVDHIRNGGNYRFARGYRFYAGHFGADIFQAVVDSHQPLTNFRHPVARIGSLYRYFRTVPIPAEDLAAARFFAVRFARERSFADFVLTDDPRIRVYTENQHARMLTGSPWRLATSLDMSAAVRTIDAMPCFYVCEEPEQSLAWIGNALGLASIDRENVTPMAADEEALPDLSEAILAINKFDLVLHGYALARLRALNLDATRGGQRPRRAAA